MSKVLIIAEKSSAGKDIARVIGLKESDMKSGYMENDKYIVGWARGHLIGQKQPTELYGKDEAWSLDKLPFTIDQNTQLKVLQESGAGAIFNTLKTLINRSDVEYIVNAGDSGREGELIQQWIYKMAGNKKLIKRLWTSSLTDESIKKAFNNLQPNEKYKNLYEEGKALKAIDWMYGMTYTVLLTKKFGGINGKALHYGRCQTPLLNLICQRENEIKNFVKEKYNVLQADYGEFKGTKQIKDEETGKLQNDSIKFNNDQEKQDYISKWEEKRVGKIESYEQKEMNMKADRCFSLSTLQQTLGKKYGYTPEKTLELAQSLYEKKYTTYPRANSEYLSEDIWAEKEKHIESCIDYIKSVVGDIKINQNITVSKNYVDNSKIEDHHAIIPTEIKADINTLNDDEKNTYTEICKRFIALFMEPYKYMDTEILINIDNELFKTTGQEKIDLGYKVLYEKDDNEEKIEEDESYKKLPKLKIGDMINIKNYILKELETKPKSRFNVSSIIKLMKKYGIGTPATQAEIIEKLLKQNVIELIEKGKKKEYAPTSLGQELIKLIPDDLKTPDLCKKVEERISEVGKGNASVSQIIAEVLKEQQDTINSILKLETTTSFSSSLSNEKAIIGKCPFCNQDMIETKIAFSHKDYKDNPCKFSIFKSSFNTTITEKMAKELIEKGKTIGTFSSKAGKKYKQEIILNKTTQKLEKGEFVNSPTKSKKLDKELNKFVNDFEKKLKKSGILNKLK